MATVSQHRNGGKDLAVDRKKKIRVSLFAT
jgi:hypothetical protein